MRLILQVSISLFILLINFEAHAATCNSVANGNWASAGTWSCGRKPNCGDTVYISHLVTIAASEDYTGCASPMFIVINAGGTMHFNNGRKLKLPCNSGVTLMNGSPGGAITANGYTGNSESLQICGAVAWQAADGPQTGPLVFGSGLPVEFLSFNAYWGNKNVHLI